MFSFNILLCSTPGLGGFEEGVKRGKTKTNVVFVLKQKQPPLFLQNFLCFTHKIKCCYDFIQHIVILNTCSFEEEVGRKDDKECRLCIEAKHPNCNSLSHVLF
jgi:hypothetical protein